MATTIRLKRGGRTHAPYYRVVVMDSRNRTRGRVLDELGVYHPCARPETRIEVDRPKALEWLQKGATMSNTARTVLSQQGVLAAYDQGKAPEDLAPPPEPETPETEEAAAAETPAPETSTDSAEAAPSEAKAPEETSAGEASPAVDEAPSAEEATEEKTEG